MSDIDMGGREGDGHVQDKTLWRKWGRVQLALDYKKADKQG